MAGGLVAAATKMIEPACSGEGWVHGSHNVNRDGIGSGADEKRACTVQPLEGSRQGSQCRHADPRTIDMPSVEPMSHSCSPSCAMASGPLWDAW